MDYDDLAADYARHRRPYAVAVEHLVAGGRLSAGSVLLEIGCGTANHLCAIIDRVAVRAVGVDPSTEMLAVARQRATRGRLAVAVAERLPIRDATVDLAYSVDVIHHVGDVAGYFSEAARVLKSGGRLATVTDSAETIRGRHPLATYFPATVGAELARYPSTASLRAAAADVGLTVGETVLLEEQYVVSDAAPFRDRANSSLHLISDEEFAAGLARLERALADGPIAATGRNVLLWATRP